MTTARLVMVCAATLALGACGGGGSAERGEEGTAAYDGPIASTDTARGERVYTALCMACHDEGPTLDAIGWAPPRLRRRVREGSGHMPPIRENRLSQEDLEAVIAYMVTTGGAIGEGGAPPPGAGGEDHADADHADHADEEDEDRADEDHAGEDRADEDDDDYADEDHEDEDHAGEKPSGA